MTLRRIAIALGVILLCTVAAGLHYVLPRHAVVYVVGTEVKLVSQDYTAVADGSAIARDHDVFFFNTANPQRTDVAVFRNEDTGMGFPPYFKFDSAELQARAQLLAGQPGQLAVVRYYGWRIPMLSMFPNATDLWATDVNEEPWPVFNILFFGLLALLCGWLWWKLRRRTPPAA